MIKTARQLKDLIRNLSKDKAADAQILMRNYMMERFLERISLSEYRDKFILKGGMLVAAMVGLDARSTMDIDATVKGATVGIEEVENMIASIISVPVDDGVEFRVKRISEIMDEAEYYYCPTGKKKGCAHPVMLKESSLIDCVRDSLKAYIGNIASLEALLTGIDQTSINQALAKEYSDHITDNERRLEQVLEFKARLYESLVGGMLTKEEYASYKAKYTKQAEDIRESVRVLKEKLTEVLENRSERNRWISQFTQFSTLETLDRRALIHMVQSIRVRGKKELDITFTHEDEYKKALQLLALAAQQKDYEQRKVG